MKKPCKNCLWYGGNEGCDECRHINTPRAAVAHQRLVRRIEQRDRKIAGLQRKIKRLEEALTWRTIDLESLSRNVRREVQDALCNVRMIPVNGMTSMNQIVEVKTTPEESKLRRQIRQLLKHRGHVAAEAIIDRWADEFSLTNSRDQEPGGSSESKCSG